MVVLAHEVWEDPDGHSIEFGLPSASIDAFRQQHEPNARLMHVIFASSYNTAMQAYYEWQGWGEYKPIEGVEDDVYTDAQLSEQKLVRPDFYR